MEKISFPDRTTVTLPVAAVLLSSSIFIPTGAAPAEVLSPPSLPRDLRPPLIETRSVQPELTLMEEKILYYTAIKEAKVQQQRLEQERIAREQQARATSKLKAAKAKAPKTVSRKTDTVATVSSISDLLNYALSLQGVPYKYGGTNPASGLDCSAFTQLVFSKLGIQLPRTASMQFRMGVGIAQAGLQPGDLVFFSTNGPGASHVGIYLGENNFISTTTKGVAVESITSKYWSKYYRGSRRVL